MPWNWGVVVKERRSMLQRIEGGRERRRAVGVEFGEGVDIVDDFVETDVSGIW
jgi:hypothetical protein